MSKQLNKEITLNSRWLPALAIIVFVMQLINSSRVWMALFVCLAGLWLVSYGWALTLSRSLALTREIRYGWAQVGDSLEERFEIQNMSTLPAVWLEVIDHSTLPNYRINRATGIGGSTTNDWRTRGLCDQRGIFNLGPTSLITGDPFGIYTVRLAYPAQRTLIVMPPVLPLPSIEIAAGGRSGEGRPVPEAPERTVSAGSVREYSPGDSLRYIHWRTTARRDKPFVRIFDGTPAGDWYIILDMNQAVQAGEGWNSTVEHSIILAASLADRGLRMKRAVGLISGGDPPLWISPQEGEGQRWEILKALALVERGVTSLDELLKRIKSDLNPQLSIVLITPDCNGKWLESLFPLIWKGITPTVILLDQKTFGGQTTTVELTRSLMSTGISHYVISRELLDRPEARPGQSGKWEWRISPLGKAIPVRKPQDLTWKSL